MRQNILMHAIDKQSDLQKARFVFTVGSCENEKMLRTGKNNTNSKQFETYNLTYYLKDNT